MSNTIYESIKSSLHIAINENGYTEMKNWTALEIAYDLIQNDVDFENFNINTLAYYVSEVRKDHPEFN